MHKYLELIKILHTRYKNVLKYNNIIIIILYGCMAVVTESAKMRLASGQGQKKKVQGFIFLCLHVHRLHMYLYYLLFYFFVAHLLESIPLLFPMFHLTFFSAVRSTSNECMNECMMYLFIYLF